MKYSIDELMEYHKGNCLKYSNNGICDKPECRLDTGPFRWIKSTCISDETVEYLWMYKDLQE